MTWRAVRCRSMAADSPQRRAQQLQLQPQPPLRYARQEDFRLRSAEKVEASIRQVASAPPLTVTVTVTVTVTALALPCT
jgi:hypothetical protein